MGIVEGDIVAFVGAGGKSSAILQAAGELAEAGVPVLVTSTTKMLVSEAEKVGPVLISEDREELRSKVAETLAGQGAAVAGSGILSKKRVDGVEPSWVPDLAPKDGVTLVEADGSRRRPLKGTAAHEPPSLTEPPSWSSLAASAPSASPYTKNVSTARKSSRSSPALVRVTPSTPAHSPGPYSPDSTTPPNARRTALLAGVEPGRSMSNASVVAHGIWRAGVRKVVLSSLPNETPGRVWAL